MGDVHVVVDVDGFYRFKNSTARRLKLLIIQSSAAGGEATFFLFWKF
jgi:hypothetical protein